MKRSVRQRLAVNELWRKNQLALLRDSETVNTTRKDPELQNPEQEGQAFLDQLRQAQKWTSIEGLVPPTPQELARKAERKRQAEAEKRDEEEEFERAESRANELDRQIAQTRERLARLERG